jgi:hypothetical protein
MPKLGKEKKKAEKAEKKGEHEYFSKKIKEIQSTSKEKNPDKGTIHVKVQILSI